ncbi:hypothetical protein CAPTEDRAFT_220878 [Capitella teleta]|uniref:GOST seven transmembrane domain-containing protein n=1 Tax=Capitella teleta TaxID=283909 RepID=R7V6P8_CAPTE|nr:hypothetical protein CAPTEDRAFT_220878 [Capitella teleta]|eukprot:ELU14214.1 hypothetical protein CAPTEDRAFT_220878 [Capitella teleta]
MDLVRFPSTFYIFIAVLIVNVSAWESMWVQHYDQNFGKDFNIYPNYMYKNAFVWIQIVCSSEMTDIQPQVQISWIMQKIDCMEEMYLSKTRTTAGIWVALSRSQEMGGSNSTESLSEDEYDLAEFQASPPKIYNCGPQFIRLTDESASPFYTAYIPKALIDQENLADTPIAIKKHERPKTPSNFHGSDLKHRVVDAWSEGMFHFMFSISSVENSTFDARVYVQMRSAKGYLPAITWPQLPVCGVMAFVYLLIGSVWIILWAKAHQHTHKIHLVIGLVSLAGAFWNTLMFVELTTINDSGTGLPGVLWASRLLSCLQLSLTQLLLLIVSTGYGINRPSLSCSLITFPALFSVLVFISNLGLVVVQDEHLRIQYQFPIVAKICYVLYALVAIIVAVWDWQHEWLLSTFSQIQVVILLVVLMWLWRPTDEQQSYGFQPLSSKEDAGGGELRLTFSDESDLNSEEDVLLDRNANSEEEGFKTTPIFAPSGLQHMLLMH